MLGRVRKSIGSVERVAPYVRGSRFAVRGSRFTFRDSRFPLCDSRFTPCGATRGHSIERRALNFRRRFARQA
jgi:hypothetical protein